MESRIPKVNKDATTLNEVYELEDLVDASLFNRMDEEALAVLKIEDFSNE